MYEPNVAACAALKRNLLATSFPHEFLTIRNESLITRARDVIAASFLNDTDFECLLFIDADIEFQPDDVARLWILCSGRADVAAGVYRHKNPEAKLAAWVDGKLRDIDEFDQPFEVDYAGTGFMMIRRQTFERLIQEFPDWAYDEGFPLEEKKSEAMKCWAFFQDPIEDSALGRFHLSEDYFFCQRVRDMGMKVFMDPEVRLKHWGLYPY